MALLIQVRPCLGTWIKSQHICDTSLVSACGSCIGLGPMKKAASALGWGYFGHWKKQKEPIARSWLKRSFSLSFSFSFHCWYLNTYKRQRANYGKKSEIKAFCLVLLLQALQADHHHGSGREPDTFIVSGVTVLLFHGLQPSRIDTCSVSRTPCW